MLLFFRYHNLAQKKDLCNDAIRLTIWKCGHEPTQWRYLAVIVVSVSSHQVDPVAVLIPERSLVRQGAVGDGDVVVVVEGGERPAVVVGHGVACKSAGQTRQQPGTVCVDSLYV